MNSRKDKTIRRPLILLVDDKADNIQLLASLLSKEGYNCSAAVDGESALARIREFAPELVLLDLMMPGLSGKDVLKTVSLEMPEIPVVVVTAESSPDTAEECMALGAMDYISKPIDPLRLCTVVHGVLRSHYISSLTEKPALISSPPPQFTEFLCSSEQMINIQQEATLVAADIHASVLITGLKGTGKTLLGTLMASHRGIRHNYDCVDLIDNTTIQPPPESEPLFLDNISTLSSERQQRLLRRIHAGTGCVMTCGAEMENLLCSDGFWKELYFCSPCRHLHLPPLQERVEDIPPLFEHFLKDASAGRKVDMPEMTLGAEITLKTLDLPGNLKQLKLLAQELVARGVSKITAAEINQYKSL